MKSEAKVYVALGAGKCAEIRISVVEEAMPTPLEGCHFREPSFSELEEITEKLWADPLQSLPPFEIIHPTRPKPLTAEAAAEIAERLKAASRVGYPIMQTEPQSWLRRIFTR